jgi:hypothetical protein
MEHILVPSHAGRNKYLQAIRDWQMLPTHTLNDVEKLYGKLLHAALVLPKGRAYLTTLEAMLAICHDRPFVPYSSPKGLSADLDWWIAALQKPVVTRPIPQPVSLHDIAAFSDASSGVGIAIVIGDFWRAWRLIPGWQTLNGQRDISWAEAIGFECLVRCLCDNISDSRHFLIHGDNKGVVEGWWNGRSRNSQVNDIFKRIHDLTPDDGAGHSFHTVYVQSKSNPADKPS